MSFQAYLFIYFSFEQGERVPAKFALILFLFSCLSWGGGGKGVLGYCHIWYMEYTGMCCCEGKLINRLKIYV